MKVLPVVTALALSLLAVACEQDLTERPPGTYSGSFLPPPGGGGGGDEDGGVAPDGGRPTRTVQGRVVLIDDLGVMPERVTGIPERLVVGNDPDGVVTTVVSAADGTFTLPGLARTRPTILAVSGEPSGFVVIEPGREDEAIVPVLDAVTLEDIAASVGISVDELSGHAVLWFEDGSGDAVRNLTVEIRDASTPAQGPFYGTGDPSQLTEIPPTATEGLVVLLNAVAGDLELLVFRAEDPDITETITLPVAAGVVTFYEVTTAL